MNPHHQANEAVHSSVATALLIGTFLDPSKVLSNRNRFETVVYVLRHRNWNSASSMGSSSSSHWGGGGGFLFGGAIRNAVRPAKAPFASLARETNYGSGVASTTSGPVDTSDRVRWLINQQSYNGAWILLDQDLSKLTNGMNLHGFTTTGTYKKNIMTTAVAIAVLESKHDKQRNLWFAIVDKARKYLQREGLSKTEVDALIDEIKDQL